jgi:hypothetical protein
VAVRIQMRRGTTSEWNSADPILNEGEIGYNTTLAAFKVGDGSTIWSELDYYQTTATITPSEINAINISEKGAANGVADLDADKNVITALKVVFEGATADAYEAVLQVTEPTQDITLSLPNTSGTLLTSADLSGYAQLSGATFTGAVSGTDLTLSGNLTVNGTTTTIDTTHLQVEDKNITLAYGNTSDVGADGGGITLLGTTNKTFTWVDATDAWTSSEHMNLVSGKSYKINNTAISAALPSLTWGEVKNGKSGLVIS